MNIYKKYHSLNYNERKKPIKYIVLHYTELKTDKEAINILCDKKSNVSAHYLVSKNGYNIYNLVDDSKRAWHAGLSYWQGQTDLNSLSIGIEISYYADVKNNIFPEFNKKQIATVVKLCKFLIKEYNIKPINILAHSDIAPERKIDPGVSFPWNELYKNGVGVFPDDKNTTLKVNKNDKIEDYLIQIGYKDNSKKSLKAFQLRYFVSDLQNNIVSTESIAFAKYLASITKQEIL